MKLATLALALATSPLTAQFVCSSTLVGNGFGPTLDVTFAPVGNAGNQTITVAGGGLDTAGVSVMVWGLTNLGGLPLPLGGCPLFTEFTWGHVINPDAGGNYSWSRSWPASVTGQYYIQLGTLANANGLLSLTSTDCRVAICTNL